MLHAPYSLLHHLELLVLHEFQVPWHSELRKALLQYKRTSTSMACRACHQVLEAHPMFELIYAMLPLAHEAVGVQCVSAGWKVCCTCLSMPVVVKGAQCRMLQAAVIDRALACDHTGASHSQQESTRVCLALQIVLFHMFLRGSATSGSSR